MTEPQTPPRKKRRRFPWLLLLLVLILGGGAWGWQYHAAHSAPAVTYESEAVQRGDISSHVSATGTLDAVTKIEVGSEVSGTISEILVDYNSTVVKGQPLAQIDPSVFRAQVEQARAQVTSAEAQYNNQVANLANNEANIRSADAGIDSAVAKLETARASVANNSASLKSAQANLQKSRADLQLAVLNYKRYEKLLGKDLVARSDRDTYYTQYLDAKATLASSVGAVEAAEANYRSAVANQRSAQSDIDAARIKRESAVAQRDAAAAQVASARAQLQQAHANLDQNEVSLNKTTIKSPIAGIVLDRKVTIGATVAASYQAPDLFTLAENLEFMQVATTVDEADIGRVRQNATVSFTVDAWPNDKFEGTVTEVRQAPVTTNNVVTYTVIVKTKNPNHKLKPGMTATVNIDVETRKNVLMIPNSALRFKPAKSDDDKGGKEGSDDSGGHRHGSPHPSGWVRPSGSPGAWRHRRHHDDDENGSPSPRRDEGDSAVNNKPQRVYIIDPNDETRIIPKRVRLGITDGTNTEVLRGLHEGDKIVTGSSEDAAKANNKGGRMRFF